MASVEERLHSLEGWRRDCGRELRELEEWADVVRPFLEQLQADLIYRQRRHAEHDDASRRVRVWVVAVTGGLVALAALGSFVLQLVAIAHGAGR